MESLLFTSIVLTSFLAGVVALLAPCCVSVMLPAFFASTFRSRTQIVGMTLIFALGLGTVILPIGLGATAISRLTAGHHTVVFALMGVAMTIAGLAILAGWSFMLPMPAMRSAAGRRASSVYVLGVFSGLASACCAPVLAGVVAVSGATNAFLPALIVGIAYVFGMVAPLAALALLWDVRDWGRSRLLAGRRLHLRIASRRWSLPLASVASGVLMVAMGALTIVVAMRGPSMPTDGWQVHLTAWLNHLKAETSAALEPLPAWTSTVLILGALGALIWRANRRSDAYRNTCETPLEVADSCCTPPSKGTP